MANKCQVRRVRCQAKISFPKPAGMEERGLQARFTLDDGQSFPTTFDMPALKRRARHAPTNLTPDT